MKELLLIADVASMLGVGPNTVRAMVRRKEFPAPVTTFGRPKWVKKKVDLYLEALGLGVNIRPRVSKKEHRERQQQSKKKSVKGS